MPTNLYTKTRWYRRPNYPKMFVEKYEGTRYAQKFFVAGLLIGLLPYIIHQFWNLRYILIKNLLLNFPMKRLRIFFLNIYKSTTLNFNLAMMIILKSSQPTINYANL